MLHRGNFPLTKGYPPLLFMAFKGCTGSMLSIHSFQTTVCNKDLEDVSLVTRPPPICPCDKLRDVSAFSRAIPARYPSQLGIDGLDIRIGVADQGLPQVVYAVTRMSRSGMVS